MIAAYHGHKNIVQILLERDADLNAKDLFGKTAFDRAKNPQITKLLQNRQDRDDGKQVQQSTSNSKPRHQSPNQFSSTGGKFSSTYSGGQSFSRQNSNAKPKLNTTRSGVSDASPLNKKQFLSPQGQNTFSQQSQYSQSGGKEVSVCVCVVGGGEDFRSVGEVRILLQIRVIENA